MNKLTTLSKRRLSLKSVLVMKLYGTSFTLVQCNGHSVGKIKAVRGDYADALQRLNQALRKAPDNTAHGFKVEVQKLVCLVELLQVLIN
jgi:hypothetical protein